MLSRHMEHSDHAQQLQSRLLWQVKSSGKLVKDNVQALCQSMPDNWSCIGLRHEPRPQRPQRLCTTVSERRACAAATNKNIRTTVSMKRNEKLTGSNTEATGACNANGTHSKCTKMVVDMRHSSKGGKEMCKATRELLQAVTTEAKAWAPGLLQIPLMLSPWKNLGGIVAAAATPCAPAPPAARIQVPYPPELQEDEEFAALMFPGFDSSSFVWKITCCQITEFAFSMFLGHNRANPTPCVLYALGASWGPAVARGQLWRLITPVMLHANLSHLLFNVFFQLRMGFGMEKQFGREKLMLIYFACGVFGNLMSVIVDPYKLAVGASTAGFGLIGVWLAEILLSWEVLGPARERTVIWIVFMLISVSTISSMTPNMDLWGHFGGALGGFLLAIVLAEMREQDRPEWYSQARTAAAFGLLAFLGGGVGKVLLFTPQDPIPDCPLLLSALETLKP